jgi:hypothetical protein
MHAGICMCQFETKVQNYVTWARNDEMTKE